MRLVDTHCHIHDSEFDFKKTAEQIIKDSESVGVDTFICVGTDEKSSQQAIDFCKNLPNCFPTVALHPHEVTERDESEIIAAFKQIESLSKEPGVVAIGECGLDYFYHASEEVRNKQKDLLRQHIELALKLDLPLIFHIRDGFEDFFKIVDEYKNIRGVVHSFTGNIDEAKGIVARGLYAGLNGILTFTKDQKQLESAKYLPIENIVIETDAPFLTPTPYRGTINEPKHVILITQFLSELRDESQALLAETTTKNAKKLFNI